MTKDEAVAAIQQGTGFRTDKATEIALALDTAIKDHETGGSLPWFLMEEDSPLVGVASVGTLTLPTDFLRLVDETASLKYTDSSGFRTFLRRVSYSQLLELNQAATTGDIEEGTPTMYALRKGTIEVAPIPTDAWTVYLTYFAKDDLVSGLAGGATNLWLTEFPTLIVNYAGSSVAGDFRDWDAKKNFDESYNQAYKRYIAKVIDRELGDREIVMGSQS